MIDFSDPEGRFAVRCVEEAARLARGVRSEMAHKSLEKSDRSPVTVADYSIQALVSRRLSQAFPEAALVAEEDSAALRREGAASTLEKVIDWAGRSIGEPLDARRVCRLIDRGRGRPGRRFWTLDPIDGTKGFLRGGHYAVCLALVEDGKVRWGVLGCPLWSADQPWQPQGPGGLVAARRGQGTWWRPLGAPEKQSWRRLRVSERGDIERARVLRSYESAHTNVGQMSRLAEEMGTRSEPIRMDSQTKYAMLACGKGDLLLRLLRSDKPEYKERIWDQAAGSLVTREAGGRVTDLLGRPLDFTAGRTLANNRGILASNGLLHEPCLEALRRLRTREPAQ